MGASVYAVSYTTQNVYRKVYNEAQAESRAILGVGPCEYDGGVTAKPRPTPGRINAPFAGVPPIRFGAADRTGKAARRAELAAKRAAKSEPVDGPIILVDRREQQPYTFEGLCESISQSIPEGDYGLLSAPGRFAIERKSREDAFSTIVADRDRFIDELQRLSTYDYAAVLIESSLRGILDFTSESSVGITEAQRRSRPRTVINSLLSWQIEYGVHVLFVDEDRDLCRRMVFRLAERFWRKDQEKV